MSDDDHADGWDTGSSGGRTTRRGTLVDRQLVLVTGKGGVGKTTVAAALAHLAAQQGRRTLLCEIEPRGDLATMLGTDPLRYEPRQVSSNLSAMSMDLEAQLAEYLRVYTHVPLLGRFGPVAKSLTFVATAAPGVREMLVVGKLADETVHHYDLVVADAPATGHIVSHLVAPRTVNELARVGLIRSQTERISTFLSDPARTGLVVVTTPEEMPVNETLELADRVRRETAVDLAGVFVNRVRPALFNRPEEEVMEHLSRPAALDELERHVGGDLAALFDTGRMAAALRRGDAAQIQRLRTGLSSATPPVLLPFLFTPGSNREAVLQLAGALGEELGLR